MTTVRSISAAWHLGQLLAEKLKAEPAIISVARENLDRWMKNCSPRVRPALQEWLDALDGPLTALLHLLTAPDERSTRLRQSNPFSGALSQSERNRILLQFRSNEAAQSKTATGDTLITAEPLYLAASI